MRVVFEQRAYFHWAPVPKDVEVKPADIKAGRVRPNARMDGYLARVRVEKDTHTLVGIAESTIIERIIHEAAPQGGGRRLSRKEAVGQLLAMNVMQQHAHPRDLKGFKVDVDDGPSEELFRAKLAPHVESGLFLPEEIEEMLAFYLEPVSGDEHVEHLHGRFGIKKAVSK